MFRNTLITICLIAFVNTSLAEDFESPHKLEAGQTLSADVLNEIIESVAYSEKIPNRDDFLGSWSCRRSVSFHPNEPPDVNVAYQATTEQGMINVTTGELVFTVDGSGNYLVTDSHPEIVSYPDSTEKMENEPYATLDGFITMAYKFQDPDDEANLGIYFDGVKRMKVVFKGSNQFELTSFNSLQMGSGIICNKTNLPPETPENTSVSVIESTVTISWFDKSDDETKFIVLRRDELDGEWVEIAEVLPTAGTDTTVTYADSNLAIGSYWYRVQAGNAHGNSLGSNIGRIDIQ